MWIVKLGGSLHDTPALHRWLRWLATAPGPARLVVPGGGPFADTVRTLQPQLGFGELAAHRMAILAMQQYGLVLQALEPELSLAETDTELQTARAAVWLPWRVAGREAGIEPSWDVTSDSLACWLAIRLAATDLLLVKSANVPVGTHGADQLAASGLVDMAFAGFARAYRGTIHVAHRDAMLCEQLAAPVDTCRVTG